MQSDEAQQLKEDLHRLAGTLPHRGACTEPEKEAAQYIATRLREAAGDAGEQPFDAPYSNYLMLAGHYAEFSIVTLISIYWPWFAFGYGTFIFLLYLGEVTGYSVLRRFVAKYPTQNVVAQILGDKPERLYIITAHYDTGRASALSSPRLQPWLRWIHFGVVACMAVNISMCALRATNALPMGISEAIQGATLMMLCAAAGFLFMAEFRGEYVRGAKGNAAGVATLLALAKRFREERLNDADVWFVATSAKEAGLHGMRHLLKQGDLDKENTYFINLDYIGDEVLHTVDREGLLATFHADKSLIDAARVANANVAPIPNTAWPSDLLLPLARGYKSIGITSTNTDGEQVHRLQDTDTLAHVDARDIIPAIDFTDRLIRTLNRSG